MKNNKDIKSTEKIIRCKYCHEKINTEEAYELGYMEKTAGDIEVLCCPYCDKEQFI